MKKYFIFSIAVISTTFILAGSMNDEPKNKVELGKKLFFDPILSKNKTISCATCHKPDYAFADTSAVSKGIYGRKGTRNTPSAMNLLFHKTFFWDGRSKTLEEQALAPIENPVEMDLAIDEAVHRLQESETYREYFKKIFDAEPNRTNLAEAIASFERKLETSNSPFDRWKFSGDTNAVSEAAKRGFTVFNGKGKCVKCHFGSDFTQTEFKNVGLYDGRKFNDSGRAAISGNPDDLGKFKSAGLRNVAVTAPYMHNGMFRTLKQVIDFYNDPAKIVPRSVNRDTVLSKPLGLTEPEKKDLEAFLVALTDERFVKAKKRK